MLLRAYWRDDCGTCAIKAQCTTGKERRVKRWEHEDVLDAMQNRLDQVPQAMAIRRQTAEHPFGTLKGRHALSKRLVEIFPSLLSHLLTPCFGMPIEIAAFYSFCICVAGPVSPATV